MTSAQERAVPNGRLVVHPEAATLAAAVAARTITELIDAQSARGTASVVVTGGGIGTATLRAIAESPARDAVDWSRVDVWWGDERFVAAESEDRNDLGARMALLDKLPLDPQRIHAMPASGAAFGDDVEAAAAAYAEELLAAGNGSAPAFDVLMLGVGPDGHIASLFPEHPGLTDERPAFAVHGSPKPPPIRISLSYPTLRRARNVYLLAAGAEKASAVALAHTGAGERQIPATGVTGTEQTLWVIDRAAGSELPAG